MLLVGSTGCGADSATAPTAAVSGLRVIQVVPPIAPEDDAAPVSIIGNGFQAGATVDIGGAAMAVTVASSTALTAFTPIRSAGVVDVVVTNPDGRSARLARAFTFAPFAVTGTSRRIGLVGDVVYVRGTGFKAGATVTMGGVAAHVVEQAMAVIGVVAPDHAPGTVDVEVTNGEGRSQTLANWFTYETVSLSVSTNQVGPGGELGVSWAAPPQRSTWDWVGLFRVGDENHQFTWARYTDGAQAGTLIIRAPVEPGTYEFRYLVDDSYFAAARSSAVTIRAGGGG